MPTGGHDHVICMCEQSSVQPYSGVLVNNCKTCHQYTYLRELSTIMAGGGRLK